MSATIAFELLAEARKALRDEEAVMYASRQPDFGPAVSLAYRAAEADAAALDAVNALVLAACELAQDWENFVDDQRQLQEEAEREWTVDPEEEELEPRCSPELGLW